MGAKAGWIMIDYLASRQPSTLHFPGMLSMSVSRQPQCFAIPQLAWGYSAAYAKNVTTPWLNVR